jgi:phosphohistidine phosphatase
MNIYLVRHGEAGPSGGTVLRDADRRLTSRGEDDARLIGRVLARAKSNVTVLLSSPLTRALQTAELIGSAFPGMPAVRPTENLSPGFRSRSLFDELVALGETADVVVVGHQPDLGNFIAYLMDVPAHGAVALPTGAAAKVVVGGGNPPADAHLEWLVTPSLLRGLGL